MNPLFDTENTEDIPFKLKSPAVTQTKNIEALFHIAGCELSVNEIRVGYYRTHKEELKESVISARVCKMIADGILKRNARGVYALKTEG